MEKIKNALFFPNKFQQKLQRVVGRVRWGLGVGWSGGWGVGVGVWEMGGGGGGVCWGGGGGGQERGWINTHLWPTYPYDGYVWPRFWGYKPEQRLDNKTEEYKK